MNPTEISEKGLESLITWHLTGVDGLVLRQVVNDSYFSPRAGEV
jgi:hypothetical protein